MNAARLCYKAGKMNWKVKAGLQWLFSVVPRGESVNYFCQRYVTHSVPISDAGLADQVAMARRHLRAINGVVRRPLEALRLFEFGAGWDLSIPLTYWALGVRRQTLLDIRALARADLVDDAVHRLPRHIEPIEPFTPLRPTTDLRTALRRQYGIDYRAPADARCTGLESGSVDAITSSSTLEHIPRDDLRAILEECYRLLTPGGVVTAHVAYDDHYAGSDQSITRLNFLRYSDRQWRFANPPLHYQSRLRHSDYIALFRAAGFELVDMETRQATPGEQQGLGSAWHPSARFASYGVQDLITTHGFFVVRKSVAQRPLHTTFETAAVPVRS
jgi:SAM-dependent methyltransferase